MLKIQITNDEGMYVCGEKIETPIEFVCSLNYYKTKIIDIHTVTDPADITITPYASSVGESLD
jgi:hypothetical protein